MKKIVLILLAAVAFGAAGAGAAEEKPLPKPDVLTEESVSTSQRLSSYDTIIIRDFKIDKAELSNIDAEEKVKVDNMRPMLARTVTDGLELELKNRKLFKNIEKNTEPKGKAVIVEGEFTEINGGNRAIRFWVGFGAGKTYLKVKGRVVDAATGKELASFEDRETGYMGAVSMQHFDELFPNQAKSLGVHIGEFISKLY